MIPEKKKSPEELAALREELGIPEASPEPRNPPTAQAPAYTGADSRNASEAKPAPVRDSPAPEAVLNPSHSANSPQSQAKEPIIHLGVPSAQKPQETRKPVKNHSLRKHDLPLAPPTEATSKTALPTQRRSPEEVAESKRREAIANLSQGPQDPGAHLRKITAHPALLIPAYLCAFGAAAAAWQRAQYFTPLALIAIATLLATYIFFAKKRSRHHSAILTIVIIMTLAFGGLHYAPLIFYAP